MNASKSLANFSLLKFFCEGENDRPSSDTFFSVSVNLLADRFKTKLFELVGFTCFLEGPVMLEDWRSVEKLPLLGEDGLVLEVPLNAVEFCR